MRGVTGRNEEHAIKVELGQRVLGQYQVRIVRGVKRPPDDT